MDITRNNDNRLVCIKRRRIIMSDMKCPFCQQELDMNMCGECGCPNEQCQKSVFMFGSEELWQELIRTRKALDVAVDALKWIDETYNLGMGYEAAIMEKCELALEQITALEQKDK